jgi:hypothetical protein
MPKNLSQSTRKGGNDLRHTAAKIALLACAREWDLVMNHIEPRCLPRRFDVRRYPHQKHHLRAHLGKSGHEGWSPLLEKLFTIPTRCALSDGVKHEVVEKIVATLELSEKVSGVPKMTGQCIAHVAEHLGVAVVEKGPVGRWCFAYEKHLHT